jgi:hypothetical protein
LSYITSFTQQVTADANNSTVLPLNAGLSFVGVATTTLGIAGIQVSMKGDQNCTVYVEQSPGILAGIGTSVTTNSVNLTGILTKFTRDFKVGDQIWVGAQTVRIIDSIASDTALTVSVAFDTDASGLSFTQHFWDISDSYSFLSSIAKFGITVQAVNSYLRIRVTNTSSVNMTYLRFQTALCPIVEAVPRSLDERGYLKTSIQSIKDSYGFGVENTPQGDMRTVIPTKLVGISFEGSTIDTNFWTTVLQNGGTIIQANGRIDVLTNTTANGSALIFSTRKARYITGYANVCRLQARVGDTGQADNVRQWGAGVGSNYVLTISSATIVAGDTYTDISGVTYTILISGTGTSAKVFATGTPTAGARTYTRTTGTGPATLTGSAYAVDATLTDGYCFQLSGTTFSVVTLIGGTPTPINSGSFNGDLGSTYVPTTNVVTWEIYYNTKTVWFVINGVVLHTASNVLTPLTNTNSLHVFIKNTNSNSSVTNCGFYCRSASIKRLGPVSTQPISKYMPVQGTAICKYGAGNLHQILVGNVTNNGAVLTVYDGLSSNAPIIFTGRFQANTNWSWDFKGMPFFSGLTVIISAQDCAATIIYE